MYVSCYTATARGADVYTYRRSSFNCDWCLIGSLMDDDKCYYIHHRYWRRFCRTNCIRYQFCFSSNDYHLYRYGYRRRRFGDLCRDGYRYDGPAAAKCAYLHACCQPFFNYGRRRNDSFLDHNECSYICYR